MTLMLDHEYETPEPKVREFQLSNGNVLRATQTDPYGFWYLSLNKGALPDEFKGAYTGWDALSKAIDAYKNLRDLAVVDKLPERPVIEYKEAPKKK